MTTVPPENRTTIGRTVDNILTGSSVHLLGPDRPPRGSVSAKKSPAGQKIHKSAQLMAEKKKGERSREFHACESFISQRTSKDNNGAENEDGGNEK